VTSKSTRDHEEIRRWAAQHSAIPVIMNRTGGLLRFEFDPRRREARDLVTWEGFFAAFDEKELELVYEDQSDSRLHKLVYAETTVAREERQAATNKPIEPTPSTSRHPGEAPGKEPVREEERNHLQKAGSRSSRTVATRSRRVAGGKVAYAEPLAWGEGEAEE